MSDQDYRLPKSIRPYRYDLCIDVDLASWQFRVDEVVDVELDDAAATVTLHALDLDVRQGRSDRR